MSASVVLVDRDPLYAWFVTQALVASGTPVTWFRDAATAMALADRIPGPALLLVDGVTWLAGMGAGRQDAASPTWPRGLMVGWDPRRTPPLGFEVLDDKPGDATSLRALVAAALASPPTAERSAHGAE
jgi:hypothetical protein